MIIDRPGAPETVLPQHGGNGGTLDTITLERGETIEQIRGRYSTTVNSITIQTNVRTLGPFGGGGGAADYVYTAPTGHEIIGFIGRSGALVDAIGVIITTR
jgi:Jacalin-like lectin domain